MFQSINPFNGEVLAEFAIDKNIEEKIELAQKAFLSWKNTSLDFRAARFEEMAAILERRFDVYGKVITLEMGKILNQSIIELNKCAVTAKFYAQKSEEYLKPQILSTRYHKSYFAFEPSGPILAIMPWNYPFWQVLRFVIPNLLLGNTVLLKHAPNVLWTAKNVEELLLESGFPKGTFQTLNINIPEVEKVISDYRIKGVTLTGSGRAGSSVASLAGKYLKKSVLELGGSDPFVVLKDANLEKAAETAVLARFQNSGQTCIAAKRWIVETAIYDEFKEKVLNKINALKYGDPLKENVDMGPVARIDLAEKIEGQYRNLISQGATALTDWERDGCMLKPQLLEVSRETSYNFTEELFGPVASLIKASDENEAIDIANETSYGLGASLWTKDLDKGEHLMRKINAGSVYLNSMVKSEGAIPFGGTNNSGYGRELSAYGMHEFANIKSYAISK